MPGRGRLCREAWLRVASWQILHQTREPAPLSQALSPNLSRPSVGGPVVPGLKSSMCRGATGTLAHLVCSGGRRTPPGADGGAKPQRLRGGRRERGDCQWGPELLSVVGAGSGRFLHSKVPGVVPTAPCCRLR